MDNKLDDVLEECINSIKTGKATIDDCLGCYPDMRGELEPLLRTAVLLQQAPKPVLSSSFRISARQHLLSAVEAKRSEQGLLKPSQMSGFSKGLFRWASLKTAAFRVAVVSLVILLLGGGTVAASANSMPNSPLYPLKLAVEEGQIIFAFSNRSKAELHIKFAKRRLGETQAMISAKDMGGTKKALLAMNDHLKEAQFFTDATSEKDEKELYSKLLQLTERQQKVLETVLTRVPEQARKAINHALEVSKRGHQQAEEAIKKSKKNQQHPSKPHKTTPKQTQSEGGKNINKRENGKH